MDLNQLGWSSFFKESFEPFLQRGYSAGRISEEHKHLYHVLTECGELLAKVSGKLRHDSETRSEYPAVGDWVVISARPAEGTATIHAVLPRLSTFTRKIAGKTTEEQIIAANINTIFLVNGLDNDFNLRRIERYLTLGWESGANPVIVLNKADICDDIAQKVALVETVALGVPVHVVSAVTGQGLEELSTYLSNGTTVAFLGSSGTGKSTLINALLGQAVQDVSAVRQGDDRGRHTTTFRKMIILPQGGIVIDTPGLRELQLWGSDEGLSGAFSDIELLAEHCHFADCRHENEPGCAVRRALEEGSLDVKRCESYLKLQGELEYLADKREYIERKEKLERHYKLTYRKRFK
ncbi:MAG TPA: ribosome small subunit-dependent GTPase A [Anaerolineae bacterium]|nr:ribosome small subunit-dependent GTPase A [Anaerolineae bacterium]